jgi:hypothetical protein
MYVGVDFDPAEQDESEPFAFDFVTELAPGETISTAAFTCTAKNGIDGAPASRLTGGATINGTVCTHTFAGALPGEVYVLHCEITTSLANTKSLWSHIPGQAPS